MLIITIVAGICGYKLRNRENEPNPTKQSAGGNTFVHNNIQINPTSKIRFGSLKRKRNNSLRMEEIPTQPTKIKELEGVLTLGEQLALEAKELA